MPVEHQAIHVVPTANRLEAIRSKQQHARRNNCAPDTSFVQLGFPVEPVDQRDASTKQYKVERGAVARARCERPQERAVQVLLLQPGRREVWPL